MAAKRPVEPVVRSQRDPIVGRIDDLRAGVEQSREKIHQLEAALEENQVRMADDHAEIHIMDPGEFCKVRHLVVMTGWTPRVRGPACGRHRRRACRRR